MAYQADKKRKQKKQRNKLAVTELCVFQMRKMFDLFYGCLKNAYLISHSEAPNNNNTLIRNVEWEL